MNLRTISIIALCLLYVAARFWRLTDSCLWFDEIFSVHAAEHSWNSILNFVALDLIHPPLFYVLLKLWIGAVGETVFWLRLLPVIFSIAAIFPFIAFCRELKLSFWTQALALFLLAVNGSLIKYAQEVRMYSLLMCLSLYSMWLFARYFYRGKSFAALVIVNVLLVYTHYFGWFVIVSEVSAILIFQRIKWRRIATMFGIVLVSFLPWMITVWQATRSGSELSQNIGWMSRPGVREIGVFVLDLIEPFYSQAATSEPASIYRISIPILLIVITSWIAYLRGWKALADGERRTIWLLLIFIKLPIIIAFIASWLLPYSIWGTRHLIIVFAPFTILAAIAVANLPVEWMRIASITLLLLLSGYAFVIQVNREPGSQVWCGFGELADRVFANNNRGPVYVFEDLAAYHLWFTFRTDPDPKVRQRVVKLENFPGMSEDKAYFLPRGFDDEYVRREPVRFTLQQMWIVFRSKDFDINEAPLNTFIANGFQISRKEMFETGSGRVYAAFIEKR